MPQRLIQSSQEITSSDVPNPGPTINPPNSGFESTEPNSAVISANHFSAPTSPESGCSWDIFLDGWSVLLHDDVALTVSGRAGTQLTILYANPYPDCDDDFYAAIYSELANSSGQ